MAVKNTQYTTEAREVRPDRWTARITVTADAKLSRQLDVNVHSISHLLSQYERDKRKSVVSD